MDSDKSCATCKHWLADQGEKSDWRVQIRLTLLPGEDEFQRTHDAEGRVSSADDDAADVFICRDFEPESYRIYGKPFHGWSCDCDECKQHDAAGQPRPGEAP